MADLPFETELHEAGDVQEILKCGTIQLNLGKLFFSFTCNYCNLETGSSLKAFAAHFQEHLVMTEVENDIFLNNVDDDNDLIQIIDDEPLHDLQSSSNSLPYSGEDMKDYKIEILDDSTQNEVDILSNNDNMKDHFIYKVRVFKNSEDEATEFHNITEVADFEFESVEKSKSPDLDLAITPHDKLDDDDDKAKNAKQKNYVCDICDVKFAKASILKMHLQQHNRCQLCYTHFSTKSQLKTHIRTAHADEKLYICEDCGKIFKNLENLIMHQRRHVTQQLYLCNTCGKSFYEEHALRAHIQTHTSARPYICKECNMTFSKPEALTLHARMHTDIRKFSCTICRMTFAQNSGLLTHMKEKHKSSFDSG